MIQIDIDPQEIGKVYPVRLGIVGDAKATLADWLAYGLEEALTDTPEIGVVRKIRPLSGLVRYEARNEAIEWPDGSGPTSIVPISVSITTRGRSCAKSIASSKRVNYWTTGSHTALA